MDHNDANPTSARQFNHKLGMILFVIYLLLYLGFVLINAFAADTMETTAIAGLNLAIVYGFGLIVAALIMALIYGMMCRDGSAEDEAEAALAAKAKADAKQEGK
ncbi:DUF485 domain-containing protein [Rubripirellula amarantea]|uniref:Inner membrane protein YjcH n=1 Tax=Rubripirellula amarantea TaxID=2527999 RepID=A0A5C5WX03_9BACT|nr:DUF485 domain-containing protein [Rubripirellula amarantea]MDA8744094.1 DUF485 domain-containing protein [Rubripirellula amarantea]TWT54513.1 hypothetical protein Pla22_21600 [Rubripirellula amarantea]